MTPALRLEILARSRGVCECGCEGDLHREGVEIDHMFGRAKADENATTCWALTVECHFKKTRNYPTAAAWLEKFITHCERHGYAESKTRAQSRLFWRESIAELRAASSLPR